MKKVDRFILTAFIGPLIAILAVVIFILVMQFLWLYIDELVGKGLSMSVILEFLFWGSCTVLPMALPLSTLLASMMTLGSMGENNELIALKAAGVSVFRVMLPLIFCSVIISVGTFYTLNNLVPVAFNKIYTLRDDIGRTKEEINIPTGTFYDGIDGYVLRIDDKDRETGMMKGVMVYDHTARKGNVSLILADSSMMTISKNKDYLLFSLYNGTMYQETNTRNYRDTSLQLQKIDFQKQEMIIPLKNYAFERSDGNRFGDQVKAMKLGQLVHDSDSLKQLRDSTKAVQVHSFTDNRSLRMSRQLDTARKNGITRDFQADGFMEWSDPEDELRAVGDAISYCEAMVSDLEGFDRQVYDYNHFIRRANVEKFRKFSNALACFILFFIGAPLGALIRKGGLATSAIVSVLFFLLYWVIDITGIKLAKDGAVTAAIGTFISDFVLLLIGLFLTWKAINDSAIFGSENIKTSWRQFKSKVTRIFRKTSIVYMGTPEFAVAPLDALVKGGYKVVGVVTVPDKPSGRGLKVNESPVKKYAVEHGLPVLQPEKLKDPAFLEELNALKGDLFVVVGFRMLPEAVWTMPKLGTFNLHAALLPQYRGAAPINWAVINGERITGVTTFMIDKQIDTGGIILREECRVADTDTAGDVHDKLMEIGAELVVQTVEGIIQKNVETRLQRSFIQGSEVLKPAPKLTPELCHIDWNDSARHIYNLIRGLSPSPGAWTNLVPLAQGDAEAAQNSSGAAQDSAEAAQDNSGAAQDSSGAAQNNSGAAQDSSGATQDNSGAAQDSSGAAQNNSGAAQDSSGAARNTSGADPLLLKIYFAETVTGSDYEALLTRAGAAETALPKPGTILTDGKTFFAIAAADGALLLKDIKLSGKKRMDAGSFLRGFRNLTSYAADQGSSRAEIAKTRV